MNKTALSVAVVACVLFGGTPAITKPTEPKAKPSTEQKMYYKVDSLFSVRLAKLRKRKQQIDSNCALLRLIEKQTQKNGY
jgi:hypothetical protein